MADEKNVTANMQIYERFRSVPQEAKKEIIAGKLKGFTDINPMWRIKCLTEAFGPAGIGWYTEITNQWLEQGPDGKTAAFCNINLYIKDKESGEWSKPIFGTGGSSFVNIFKGKQETSDEAYKMAYTDAMSVACKVLGIGADVYWAKDRTKYSDMEQADTEAPRGNTSNASRQEPGNTAEDERKNQEMIAKANATKIDATKAKVVRDKMKLKGVSESSILKFYKLDKCEDMVVEQWTQCMMLLDKYPDKK